MLTVSSDLISARFSARFKLNSCEESVIDSISRSASFIRPSSFSTSAELEANSVPPDASEVCSFRLLLVGHGD